jgi:thymidylate synthase
MSRLDKYYQQILQTIYRDGEWEINRTGIRAKTIPSATINVDMEIDGFPLLTIKKTSFKNIAVEIEGFIKGVTSKKWFQERGCRIWDEWANPQKAPYGTDEQSKKKMLEEDDLGLIYGAQWRNFHDPEYMSWDDSKNGIPSYPANSVDQLLEITKKLRTNPQDRRMICSSWNPLALDQQALPPCHVLFQTSVINNKLNLCWFQRSTDAPLGLPYNIASYGLLLHLLAKIYGFREGQLTGFLSNVHFYENQQKGVEEILNRESPYYGPTVKTLGVDSIFDWDYSMSKLENYQSLPKVRMPVAV